MPSPCSAPKIKNTCSSAEAPSLCPASFAQHPTAISFSPIRRGNIIVLRGVGANGKAAQIEKFATGLDHPRHRLLSRRRSEVRYVGNATTIQRFPYHSGDLHATGAAETIVPESRLRTATGGGHWTRDVTFTKDGQHMLISVGSGSNIDDPDTHPKEFHRARHPRVHPRGQIHQGLRLWHPQLRRRGDQSNDRRTMVLRQRARQPRQPSRARLHDLHQGRRLLRLAWYYMGNHQDPRLPQPCANGTGANPQAPALTAAQAKDCKRVDMSSKVITPDVLVQPHMASLQMVFYPDHKSQFPAEYSGDAFAAEHGSWNRANRAGYEVVRIPMHNGHAEGSYEDFLTGFVTKDGEVWGHPVGVQSAKKVISTSPTTAPAAYRTNLHRQIVSREKDNGATQCIGSRDLSSTHTFSGTGSRRLRDLILAGSYRTSRSTRSTRSAR